MDTINLIIDINIDKIYLKKSLMSLLYTNINKEYKKKINMDNIEIETVIENIDKEKNKITLELNNDNIYLKYLYNPDNNLSKNQILEYIFRLILNTQKYTKNIYPEYGNDWTIFYNNTENNNTENNNTENHDIKNNICIVS